MRRIVLIGLVAVLFFIPAVMAAGCGKAATCCGERIACPNYQAGDCPQVSTGLVATPAQSPTRISYTVPLSMTGQNNCLRLRGPFFACRPCFAASEAASRCYLV